MRCPVVVGRDVELAALRSMISATAQGSGSAGFVVGGAGIGKSALTRALIDTARARGLLVLAGRCVASQTPVAFRPLAEALLSTLRHAGLPVTPELAPFRPALSRLIPQWREQGALAAEDSPVILGEGLLRLLRELGPAGSLLVLEDLQWADPETLGVVEYLCDNLANEPSCVLGTTRPEGQPPLVAALAARRAAAVLDLEPLAPPDVEAMIEACPLPPGFDPAHAAEVAAVAEGVPLLVEEILSLATDPRQLGRPHVPATVAATVRRRLTDLDVPSRRLLVCAALLGRRFDWRLLAPATGLDESSVLAALGRGIDLQLLDGEASGFRFRHALTRDAVLQEVLPPELSRLAAATRSAVEKAHPGLPEQWCTLAAELAQIAGERDAAAELLMRAGRRALQQAALGTAEHLLGRARQLSTTASRRLDSGELLTEVLAAAGKVDDAAELARTLLGAGGYEPARRARLQLRLARAAVVGERWQLAHEQLDSARPIAEHIPPLAAEHAALCAQVAIGEGRPDSAGELAAAAVEAAVLEGLPEVACEALEVIGRVERQRSLPAARKAFERAAQLAELHGLVFWQLRALHELGTVDMFATGRLDRLEQARDRAADAGALMMVAVLDVQLAGGLWISGDGARCLAAGGRAAEAGRRFRVDGIRRVGLCFTAIAHSLMLDPAGLEAAARALASAGDDPEFEAAVWGDGRCVYALLTEDRRRAVLAVESAADLGIGCAMPMPSPWWGLWPLLRAVDGGAAELALEQARRALPGRWNDAMFGYARAVLLGRRRDPSGASAQFEEADAAAVPWPWWRHLGRRLVAEAALEDGWGQPLTWLGESAVFFDEFRAPAVASACRSLLRRAGAPVHPMRRPTGAASGIPSSLAVLGVTGREAEVLGLVGQGLSNREVAARLYLSPRTVEKHVENLARKLGTGSRSQLVAYAATTP